MAPLDELKQAQKDGTVRGLSGIPNATPVPRLDIDELLDQSPDAFNLFLLALERLQDETKNSQNSKMSFYEIAGIHGLPKSYWNDIEPITDDKVEQRQEGWGYCAHSTPTFPTWHRPYLALYEQSLYYTMNQIVQEFDPQYRQQYQKALESFRLPYWDYYRPRYARETVFNGITGADRRTTSFPYDFSMPRVFTESKLTVRRPGANNPAVMDPNPLSYFKFPTIKPIINAEDFPGRFNKQRTQRFPNYGENIKTASPIPWVANKVLNNQRESNITNIMDMLVGNKANDPYKNFVSFATNSVTPGSSGNLEDLHGAYHVMVGGNSSGHMSYVPLAAFDPIFWMHHCQIDRFFAIWQAAHPDSWFNGKYDPKNGTGVQDAKSLAQEAAVPFYRPDKTSFWNGDLSKNTATFGYVYKDAIGGSADQVKTNFRQKYGWLTFRGVDPSGLPASTDIPASMVPKPVDTSPVFQPVSAFTKPVAAVTHAARMAPQVAMQATEAVAALVAPAPSSDLVNETTPGAAAADTKPVTPGEAPTQVAFSNLVPEMTAPATPAADVGQTYREWYVDQVVERLALNDSFTIFYFIGNFDNDNALEYIVQPTLAGLSHNFTAPVELCDNCGYQATQGHLVSGTNVITPLLLDYVKIGVLQNTEPEHVVPFLITNLKWRIVTATGDRVNPRDVAGFKVGVSSKIAAPPGSDASPVFEEYPQIIEQIINDAS